MEKEKFCPDCNKIQPVDVIIPVCDKNPDGKTSDEEHGNEVDGMISCTDEYCNPDEKIWDGVTPLSEYSDWYYRCHVCDTLNVN